jgi:hypothetical protein
MARLYVELLRTHCCLLGVGCVEETGGKGAVACTQDSEARVPIKARSLRTIRFTVVERLL